MGEGGDACFVFFLTENRTELTVAPAQHLQFASRKPLPIRLRHSLSHMRPAPFLCSVQRRRALSAGGRALIVYSLRLPSQSATAPPLAAPSLPPSLPLSSSPRPSASVAVGGADGATIFCHPCNVRAAAPAAAAAAATAAAPNGGCGAVSAQLHLCLQTYRTFTRAR